MGKKKLIIDLQTSISSLPISLINYNLIGILFGYISKDFQNVYVFNKKVLKEIDLISRSSFVNPELSGPKTIASFLFVDTSENNEEKLL